MHYYTAEPALDATRWEADQDAQAEREEAAQASRRAALAYEFLDALAYDEPLPVRAIGADLNSLICEQSELVAPVIKWAALHRKDQPALRYLLEPLADAWARDVEDCAK